MFRPEKDVMAIERFPVEAGHVMLFARAVGDPNPVYFDPSSDGARSMGGLIAPPTFTMAGQQFDAEGVRPRPGVAWFGSGRDASGGERATTGALHAEQHFKYHRPLRVGDVLTATLREGDTWSKESKRGGKLVFSEHITDYFDEGGELVVTARMIRVITERPVTQEG